MCSAGYAGQVLTFSLHQTHSIFRLQMCLSNIQQMLAGDSSLDSAPEKNEQGQASMFKESKNSGLDPERGKKKKIL